MKKQTWINILMGFLVALAIIGVVLLTIWLWEVLPRWLFFALCGLDILTSGFWIWRISR